MNRREEHKEFDSWLVNQLDGQKHVFKDEYWIAAQQLIEADEAGRNSKRRYWMFWLNYGLQGLALLCLLGYWGSRMILPGGEGMSAIQQTEVMAFSSEANGTSNAISLSGTEEAGESNAPEEVLKESTATLENFSETFSSEENTHQDITVNLDTKRPEAPITQINTQSLTSPLSAPEEVQRENSTYSTKVPAEPRLTNNSQVKTTAEVLPKVPEEVNLLTGENSTRNLLLPPIDSIQVEWEADWQVDKELGPISKLEKEKFSPYLSVSLRGEWQTFGSLSPISLGIEGAGPLLGIRARYRLSPRTELFAGASYLKTSAIEGQVDINSRLIKFGLNQDITRYEIETLHMVDLPLGVRRYLGGRHSVQLSLHPLILMDAKHSVSRVRKNAFDETRNDYLGEVNGIRQGIRSINLGIGAGYDYQLSRQLLIGIEAQLYPQGFFLDSPYSQGTQSPFMIGVGIEYDILKIK
ncbi:MAG: hypothetical protein AAGC85_21225 [Bacteroidota bacterium]